MFSELTAAVKRVLSDDFAITDATVSWDWPEMCAHGDCATNVALQVAKRIGKEPVVIANVLAGELAGLRNVEKAEVAGPGYVNVWLTPSTLISALSETRKACTAKVKRSEPPVVVEYSSPNIAKPLGVHHILSTIVGQVIANLYEHQGYDVRKVNHIGDWGTQFGKLAVAFEKWGDKPLEECSVRDLLALYVRFHDEAEKHPELEDEGRAAFRKLEGGDPDLHAFWEKVVKISMLEIKMIYKRLHVDLEYDHGESMYRDMMMPIIEEGREKGVFKEGEGDALIAEFPEESHMPPAIVLKADGSTIYHTRDLATIRYRINTWHPQSLLYVVDVAQQLYFRQLFAMVDQLEWDLPHLEHVIFGRMRFADASMSSRKGNILFLEDVLDEAVRRADAVIAEHGDSIVSDDPAALAELMGVGAVAYGILSQNRKQDIVFDWDKMLSFDGNSAPYLQYTHARTRSVLQKAGVDSGMPMPKGVESLSEKERTLIGTLLQFQRVLEEARAAHMPHTLANYLFALAQDYNAFYNQEPILKASEPERSLRLLLTGLTADVLRTGSHILTLRLPDRM